jgi:hypothetical protein
MSLSPEAFKSKHRMLYEAAFRAGVILPMARALNHLVQHAMTRPNVVRRTPQST